MALGAGIGSAELLNGRLLLNTSGIRKGIYSHFLTNFRMDRIAINPSDGEPDDTTGF